MKIAIASGKGGTGKTTIAVNLACFLADAGTGIQLLDCDVEEPNDHLFLKPAGMDARAVTVKKPTVDESLCTHCGRCTEVCAFHAITVLPGIVLTFPELCHGCGACALFCPARAITEVDHPVGIVEKGFCGNLAFVQGRLNVGEIMTPAVIRAVKAAADRARITLIDAPPGTTCPMIEAVRETDLALLVTEPTPFGLHDLRLAVEALRILGLPLAVVLNRADIGDDRIESHCAREGISLISRIPQDRRIAESYARGEIAVRTRTEYGPVFLALWRNVLDLAVSLGIAAPSIGRTTTPAGGPS